ncbi:MAG: hypothetical protein Tsb002_21270 [Wenzhouxiangellaceae bacterium]
MADTPVPELIYSPGCGDCGQRRVTLPEPLPPVGDDFDWMVRDYDGFRLFMLEELAARFGERRRWTAADLEVVLVEALAVVLDQLSDQLDRTQAEAFLESARQPASVRRLLAMIGYDAVQLAGYPNLDDPLQRLAATADLERRWSLQPRLMEAARQAGPRAIRTQRRMVTPGDYASRLDEHPLVLRAHAASEWTGSWLSLLVAVVAVGNLRLDDSLNAAAVGGLEALQALHERIDAFHAERGLTPPDWAVNPPLRAILRPYLDNYRMAAQEVWLTDAEFVGIQISLSVRVAGDYFQSEIRQAVLNALGTGVDGFFAPGRLYFGEDLHASDVIEAVMALDGVAAVCLNRFKRVGKQWPEQSGAGRIELRGLQIAVCDNDPARPERGYLRLVIHGGRRG